MLNAILSKCANFAQAKTIARNAWTTITLTVGIANSALILSQTASSATPRPIAGNANQDFTLMMITIVLAAALSHIALPVIPLLTAKLVSQVTELVLTIFVKVVAS